GAPVARFCVSPSLAGGGSIFFCLTSAADRPDPHSFPTRRSSELKFEDCVGNVNYSVEYYNNKPDFGSGDVVNVTAGATTSGINRSVAHTSALQSRSDAVCSLSPLKGMCASASAGARATGTSNVSS